MLASHPRNPRHPTFPRRPGRAAVARSSVRPPRHSTCGHPLAISAIALALALPACEKAQPVDCTREVTELAQYVATLRAEAGSWRPTAQRLNRLPSLAAYASDVERLPADAPLVWIEGDHMEGQRGIDGVFETVSALRGPLVAANESCRDNEVVPDKTDTLIVAFASDTPWKRATAVLMAARSARFADILIAGTLPAKSQPPSPATGAGPDCKPLSDRIRERSDSEVDLLAAAKDCDCKLDVTTLKHTAWSTWKTGSDASLRVAGVRIRLYGEDPEPAWISLPPDTPISEGLADLRSPPGRQGTAFKIAQRATAKVSADPVKRASRRSRKNRRREIDPAQVGRLLDRTDLQKLASSVASMGFFARLPRAQRCRDLWGADDREEFEEDGAGGGGVGPSGALRGGKIGGSLGGGFGFGQGGQGGQGFGLGAQPPGNVSITAAEDSPFAARAVRLFDKSQRDLLRRCYARSLSQTPGLAGRHVVSLVVDPQGKASEVKTLESLDKAVAACAERAVMKTRFPQDAAKRSLTLHLDFDPRK